MIIVFYTPIEQLSGGNLVMRKYAEFLVSKGHEVYVIVGAKEDREYTENGVIYRCFNKYLNNYIGNCLFLLPYIKNYVQLTPECDIVIPIFFPLIFHALAAKIQNRCKKVIALFQDHKGMFWFGKYIYSLLCIKPLIRKIDEIVAVSQPTANEIQSLSGRTPVVIKNSIEKDIFFNRNCEKENYILFVGSGKEKGLPVFIAAFNKVLKEFPYLKAKVVGPKTETNNNIEYIPYTKNRNELAELYSKALIYVNQSPSDSFGLPSLEAMACGTAVVLTDTVGSRDFAINEENALIVPANNAQATVNAIMELLKDDVLRHKLEKNGLKTVKRYDWEKSCNEILSVLENKRRI